jgi:thioredoxin 1
MMSQVNAVGTGNFETEVMQSNQPVVVEFWGEECPPCRMIAPVLDKLAGKFGDQLKIVKCNVFENQELAIKYGVNSIPNLIFFKEGQVVDQTVGYRNEAQLSAKINSVLDSNRDFEMLL